jgi:hypothetical protein
VKRITQLEQAVVALRRKQDEKEKIRVEHLTATEELEKVRLNPHSIDLGDDHIVIPVMQEHIVRPMVIGYIMYHRNDRAPYLICTEYIPTCRIWNWTSDNIWSVKDDFPESLTITPSVVCKCGDHGFITGGEWKACGGPRKWLQKKMSQDD